MYFLSKGALTASSTGTVAYRTGGRLNDQIVSLDRSGTTIRSVLAPDEGGYFNPVVSGDGRVLFQRRLGTDWDIWLADSGRRGLTRTTLNPAAEICPVWSPDGQRFVFTSDRAGSNDLYQRTVGGGDELLLKSSAMKIATDWSRDGHHLLYRVYSETRSDLLGPAADRRRGSLPTGRNPVRRARRPVLTGRQVGRLPVGRIGPL